MRISKLVLPIIGISFLASCAATNNDVVLDNTTNEGQVQIVNNTFDSIPDWFMNPEEVEGSIVSTGTSTAPDLQLAIDIAVMNAKTVLADRLNGKLSGMIKNYISKVGQANIVLLKVCYVIQCVYLSRNSLSHVTIFIKSTHVHIS